MHFCPLHHIWLKVGQGRPSLFGASSNERALIGGMTIAWSLKEEKCEQRRGGRLAGSQMARLGGRWWQLTNIFTWKHEGQLLAAKTSQINWSLQSKTTFPGFVTISIPYED